MGLTLGVAENDIDAENYGGLKLLTQLAGGGAEGEKRALAAIAGAQALSPATEKVDAAQLAIRFFSQMGANASRPGATLLGSAAESLPTAANYLAEVNKRNKELERARGPLAVQLATAMKPPTAGTTTAGSYKLNKNIDGVGKAGDIVTLSTADALLYAKADPSALLKFDKPSSGTETERFTTYLTEIGPKIVSGDATPVEIATYSTYYQKLTKGYESSRSTPDGKTETIRIAGIDLTDTALPIPEGFDAEKILDEKARNFGPQAVTAGFAERMLYTEGLVREVLNEGYKNNFKDLTADEFSNWFGTTFQTDKGQRFYQASRNFIAAVLRKESGAAISDGEYTNGLKQYFPSIGDTQAVIDQKEALRDSAVTGMVNDSGDAFSAIYPNAVSYLSFTVGDEKEDVINPRGYSTFKLQKTLKGRDLYFNSTLPTLTIQDLEGMLQKPNAKNIYTIKQIQAINAELNKKKKETAEALK